MSWAIKMKEKGVKNKYTDTAPGVLSNFRQVQQRWPLTSRPGVTARGGGMGMGTSSEEVGDGSCTSAGAGIKRVTDSVTGVWYDPSVGGEDGGEGDEASCL